MDAVTVIETALATGAVVGLKDTATAMVKDAYAGLKALVLCKVKDVPGGEVAVERHAEDSATWQSPVRKALEASGAIEDPEILGAALELLELADPKGSRSGKYVVVTASGKRSAAVGGNVGGSVVTGDIQR